MTFAKLSEAVEECDRIFCDQEYTAERIGNSVMSQEIHDQGKDGSSFLTERIFSQNIFVLGLCNCFDDSIQFE